MRDEGREREERTREEGRGKGWGGEKRMRVKKVCVGHLLKGQRMDGAGGEGEGQGKEGTYSDEVRDEATVQCGASLVLHDGAEAVERVLVHPFTCERMG